MNSGMLRRIGETLEGERWQVPLSRKLGVAERSLRYWLAGREIPNGVEAELLALLADKHARCAWLMAELNGGFGSGPQQFPGGAVVSAETVEKTNELLAYDPEKPQ